MKNYLKLLPLLSLFIFSFQSENNFDINLLGTWVPAEVKDQTYSYRKTQKFLADSPGIRFMEKGKFLKRMNNGWHDKDPVMYENYEGTWKQIDSTFVLKYNSPAGEIKETWELISLDSLKLVIKVYGRLYNSINKEK